MQTQRMGGVRILSDDAQHKTGLRAIEEPRDNGAETKCEIDDNILMEKYRSKQWDIAQDGNIQLLDRKCRRTFACPTN
jgi:hypothetical protein